MIAGRGEMPGWLSIVTKWRSGMAKDGNTYAKRQRETLKRQKAAEKRDRRKKRKDGQDLPGTALVIDHPPDEPEPSSLGAEQPQV